MPYPRRLNLPPVTLHGPLRHAWRRPAWLDIVKRANTDDAELLASARNGDQTARAEVVERFSCIPAMMRLRERQLSAHLSAEERRDAVQEAVTSLWAKLERYHSGSPLEAWIWGFVVREHYRALDRRRKVSRDVLPEGLSASPAHLGPGEDECQIIHRSIGELGSPSRDIVRMRHFESLTFEEIGERLDLPTNTVKTRYYRALQRLRVLLGTLWKEVEG